MIQTGAAVNVCKGILSLFQMIWLILATKRKCLSANTQQQTKNVILNVLAYFDYKKKMFKPKYLATNDEITIGDAAGTVAVIVVDAVELQSMFENLFYRHFKCSSSFQLQIKNV